MIRLTRVPLPRRTAEYLVRYGSKVEAAADRKAEADHLWKHNTTVRRKVYPQLRQVLGQMAPGHERCMYCGDSQGCAVDHFEPLAVNPLRVFDWANHFLACTVCNSHYKRDAFPRDDANGSPLLLDPTCEEPLHHLHLHLPTGQYTALSAKGQASIEVFGLNRPVLVKGRTDAYRVTRLFLEYFSDAVRRDDQVQAEDVVRLAWNQPMADVLASMFHQAVHPAARHLFAGEDGLHALLADRRTRTAFLSSRSAMGPQDARMP